MVALALLAGTGTGLFNPAAMAWLPQLVSKNRLPAATALFGALGDAGYAVGPLLAAVAFAWLGPEPVVIANGLTFGLSAALLLALGPQTPAGAGEAGAERASVLQELREGLHAIRGLPGVQTVLVTAAAGVLFAGALNLGEFLLAKDALGAGDSGFAFLVAMYGVGLVFGSLGGSGGGDPATLKARFLGGLLLQAIAIAASGAAPVVMLAMLTFALTGFGDSYMLVHERLLFQATVPQRLLGRVFGMKEALSGWAFAGAFLGSSFVASVLGPRPLFFLAGALCLLTWALAAMRLRGVWRRDGRPASPAHALGTARPSLVESS
jgi:MFS family permease